jgi:hypothetical protein
LITAISRCVGFLSLTSARALGAEDEYDTLYEQHNPDYIPEERGDPAILVAKSQNNQLLNISVKNLL